MIDKSVHAMQLIGFPAFPFWLGVRDEQIQSAEVSVLLESNEEVRGKLVDLDFSHQYLMIQNQHSPQGRKISFQELAYLSFIKTYSFDLQKVDPVYTGSGVELPNQNKPYSIHLKNNITVEGQMRAFVVNESGIHVFHDSNNMLKRLFIPHTSVQKSKLGKKIGEDLLEKDIVKAKQVSSALYDQAVYRNQKVGEYLLEQNVIDENELEQVLKIQQLIRQNKNINVRIGDLLLREKIVNESQLNEALTTHFNKKNAKIGDILVSSGQVSDIRIHDFLSNNFGIPFVKINDFKVNPSATNFLPFELAKKYSAFPLEVKDKRLLVTFYDPLDQNAIAAISQISGQKIEITTSTKSDILEAYKSYYGSELINENFEELEQYHFDEVPVITPGDSLEEKIFEIANARTLINLVDSIIHDAVVKNVSKIVLKPGEHEIELLYKYSKSTTKIRSFHQALLPLILLRIKFLANMSMTKSNSSHYGVATLNIAKSIVDIRVSILETVAGESAVLHLIKPSIRSINLNSIGINKAESSRFVDMLIDDKSLILLAGRQRIENVESLYAVMNEMHSRGHSILTLEDTIKCHLPGIEQVWPNAIPNFTYPQIMQHISAHEPDVLMIEEIVDTKTARIALETSLSGRRVISSIQADDAYGAVSKLLQSDGTRSNVLDALSGIFAQKTVRANCVDCLSIEDVDMDHRTAMGVSIEDQFYISSGCESCNGRGFKEKLLVYELLEITDEVKNALSKGTDRSTFYKLAVNDEMDTLKMKLKTLAQEKKISFKEAFLTHIE